jgi:hypothetical protein
MPPLSVAETLRLVELRLQTLMYVQMHSPVDARPTAGTRGLGSMFAALKIFQTVEPAMWSPSPMSSPWMRR